MNPHIRIRTAESRRVVVVEGVMQQA